MNFQRQLALATRGFRGDFGEKYYINESISLDEGTLGITISDTVRVSSIESIKVEASIESVSVDVRSIEIEGAI
jgi:hypothetical protein